MTTKPDKEWLTEETIEVAVLDESFPYPGDGIFRYKVGLVTPDGHESVVDFNTRWSPRKIDNIEIGVAAAAQINALGKQKVIPLTAERIA